MGRAKQYWMEQLEDVHADERMDWIRDQLGDDEADEDHPEWARLQAEFDAKPVHKIDLDDYDDDWVVEGKTRVQIFRESMDAVTEIVRAPVSSKSRSALLVMLYAHVVTAVEAYFSSTFIDKTLSSENYIRKMVESDPAFGERKFSIKEIFVKRESLKNDIGAYLRDLIFHDLKKVKEMYMAVFGIDLGDVGWLFKAILVRHDCVHRAGYSKDGKPAALAEWSITELVQNCWALVARVEQHIAALPAESPPNSQSLEAFIAGFGKTQKY